MGEVGGNLLWSPATVAVLAALAMAMIWMAFSPARPRREVESRMDDYLERGDIIQEEDLSKPFLSRAILPIVRGLLRFFGRLLPQKGAERVRLQLQQAGNPLGLSVLDFYGLRILLPLLLMAVAALLVFRSGSIQNRGILYGLRFVGLAAVMGFIFPGYWLRSKIRQRRNGITRALPDALDMLTIGVEAGLAFESAMVRVGEKWDNLLTREFKRAVAEMRVGSSREEALVRMAERCDVPDLTTFVAVLVQSTQLGVSIAQVLHAQAVAMRERRRQRAEELARQAGIKMLIPLVFFIFPALMIAILGPAVPGFVEIFGMISGGR